MRAAPTPLACACVLVLSLAAGCRGPEPPLPDWTRANPAAAPPNPRFAELLAIGLDAERAAPRLLGRTEFFPAHRKAARLATAPLIARLGRLQRGPIAFEYRPTGFVTSAPGRRGWRLLGRVLAWTISDAVAAKRWAGAIERWRMATRLGFDLTGGGAADATLGLAIADEARLALAPSLRTMPRPALLALAAAAVRVFAARPLLDAAVRNEASNRRVLLQEVQDAYAAGRTASLTAKLGSGAEDDLARLTRGDRAQALAAFSGLAADIANLERTLVTDARRPARSRSQADPIGRGRGAALRLALLGGMREIVSMNDSTLARTRLLVAEARLRAAALAPTGLPKRLATVLPKERTDPYSGDDLVYRRDGKEFSVYSVGADGKDDGGQSDAAGETPDLRLER